MLRKTLILVVAIAGLAAVAPPASAAPGSGVSQKSFTVIAVVDGGINPYHVDFRQPGLTVHPSRYISGFPRSAPSLRLSLDEKDLLKARTRDKRVWGSVKRNTLYWIPGTNIIGAIGPFDSGDTDPILDNDGHGTATASLAGGAIHGPRSDRVLIVAVKGYTSGLRWAARQPWIDAITNSWGPVLGVLDLEPGPIAEASRLAVKNGKVVCFATGNTAAPGFHDPTAGPSWIVNVGAASETTRGEHAYTAYPNDVLGLSGVDAASNASITGTEEGFSGTSAASPNACGEIARTIAEVRAASGDTVEGPHGKELALVTAHGLGALKDGIVLRREIEDAIHATATPAETSPPDPDDVYGVPAAPVLGFLRGGYGIVDHRSADSAIRVLLGKKPVPDRTLEDAWFAIAEQMRDAIWGEPPN